jgi:hypothetical protein
VEISIFILLRILLLLWGGKRDAISGWLATLPTSVASFRSFFRHAPTSSHLLPSNHTLTRCQFSHIALWRDVYKRDREQYGRSFILLGSQVWKSDNSELGGGGVSPVCDVATSLKEILPLSYNKRIYMARTCSWQNNRRTQWQRSTYWSSMTPEDCSLYVTLHPQTESLHCYSSCRKYVSTALPASDHGVRDLVDGTCSTYGTWETKNFDRKAWRVKSFGRPRSKWVNHFKLMLMK